MKNPDHPVFWVVDGGFEAMSELGNHFSKEHADYIYESVTKNVDFKLPHAIFAIEESLLAKNLNDETKEIVITLLNKLRQYDKEDLFNKYPNISRLLSESGDDVITDLNFNKASIG